MIKIIESIFGWCNTLLLKIGFNPSIASYVSIAINTALLCALAYSIYIIFRMILVTAMIFIARKTKTKFDDLLVSASDDKNLSIWKIL